jgi:stage II sporulation protein GA (sporulation sigma-E factor processing peptidase)
MPVIYADVVWLVNAVLDAVVLVTTCWVLKVPVRFWRVVAGAVAGACYSLLLFVPPLSIFTTWPGKAVASFIIVAIGVPCRNWVQWIRACFAYYLVSFVFAGAAIALHFAIPGNSLAGGAIVRGNGLEFVTSVKSLALLTAIPCGAGLLKFVLNRVQRHRMTNQALYRVHATIGDQSVSFTGLADTGNQLRDPLTRKPVCLVDAAVMKLLLPSPIREAIEDGGDLFAALDQCADSSIADRISLVPYRGAGGRQQIALAVRPDKMEIELSGRRYAVSVPCLLALHADPLSLEGRFQSILHIEVLTGVDRLENNSFAQKVDHETAHSTAAAVDTNPDPAERRS